MIAMGMDGFLDLIARLFLGNKHLPTCLGFHGLQGFVHSSANSSIPLHQ